MILSDEDLKGKSVVAKDGRTVGKVEGCQLDFDLWRVVSIRVRVARAMVGPLGLKKPLLGSATLDVRVDSVEGVADVVVLRLTVEELRNAQPRVEPASATRATASGVDVSGPKVTVALHGHCFDGAASAATFARFYRERIDRNAAFRFRGLMHRPEAGVDESVLDGEINAIVDFRYSTSAKLDWWFDHHKTAFVSETDRAHFAADASGKKFFDPDYGSCTQLVADVTRSRFSFDTSGLTELLRWADLIDAARFPDAKMAVELKEPALQLMTVLEHHGDDKLLGTLIPRLMDSPLDEVATTDPVARLFGPLRAAHQRLAERFLARASQSGGVVYADLTDESTPAFNKFLAYHLFPEARYSVTVTSTRSRAKVSVGFNPWSPRPRAHDIAELCKAHGGGGHAVVGAVSLPADAVPRAIEVGQAVATALRD